MERRPVGIVAALPEEEAILAALLVDPREVRTAGTTVRLGTLDGRPVALARSGVGRTGAALVATLLCDRHAARALVMSGVAGGVAPGTVIGDVVVADRIVDVDYGRRTDAGLLRYRPGVLPLPENPVPADPSIPADPALLAAAHELLDGLALPEATLIPGEPARRPRIHFGPIATGGAFVASAGWRDTIGAETGALAVEMEGVAIAEVAGRFGAPWLVVRALSDRAGSDSHADFGAFLSATATNAGTIVRALLPALDAAAPGG